MSPVKELALKHNIKVLQPKKLKNEYQNIIDLNPDVIITCAYGQILPYELLSYPKYKTINVHASLLPKLRGGAPIQRAIMDGYKTTGVTIMRTEVGMDDGDMISSYEIEIKDDDTYETLSSKLSIVGKELLIKTLPSIFDGTCKYIKQNEDEVTFAKIIKKEDEYLSFDDTTINIYNKIRALSPEPCCYFNLNNERVKIYNAKIGNFKASSYGKITNISTHEKIDFYHLSRITIPRPSGTGRPLRPVDQSEVDQYQQGGSPEYIHFLCHRRRCYRQRPDERSQPPIPQREMEVQLCGKLCRPSHRLHERAY